MTYNPLTTGIWQITVFKCKNLKVVLAFAAIALEKIGRLERKWGDIWPERAVVHLQPFS